ncbi:MAG: hypothetical protein GF330_05915 [Candidatus Eisenbacteria bacterium]|nr:hypothetical protein [Candidatus Eisenbacteria bacterium]
MTILVADSDADFARDMASVLGSRYEVRTHTDPESVGGSDRDAAEVAIISLDLLDSLVRILPFPEEGLQRGFLLELRKILRVRHVLILGSEASGAIVTKEEESSLSEHIRAAPRYPRAQHLLALIDEMLTPGAEQAGTRSDPHSH